MKSTYQKVKFGDLYSIPSRNGLSRPESVRGSGYKMINMGELFAYDRIGDIPMELVSMSPREINDMCVEEGDLLFARQSLVLSGAGKASIIERVHEKTTFESHIIRVRLNKDKADPLFYYYYFKSPYSGMRSIVQQGVQAGIRGSDLQKLFVDYPALSDQKNIASFVDLYDQLIDTNRRRIQLLEESARLLFREWFVYFRFPGHEKAKIIKDSISKTPEGWGKEKVINVVKRVAPGELYDQATAELIGIVPILDQGQSGIIGYHNNEPSVIASLDNPVIVFANHTCNQRIIHFPFSAIQNIFPFLPSDENYRNIYWLHYATDNLIQLNAYKGHWPEFMAKNILLPPEDLCDEFGNIISMIHKQIFYLSILNKKLAQARDLLLPRLMSGAIEV